MGKSIALFIRVISTVLVVLFVSIWITSTDWNTVQRHLPQMAPVYRVEAVEERAGTRADSRKGEKTDVAAIRRVLSAGLAKIEEDVLTLDIGKIVGSVGNETTLHNRLLAKLQGSHLQRPERCVVRIAIQLNHLPKNVIDFQTIDRFTCSPSLPLPCDIERRFVVNIASDAVFSISDVVIFGLQRLRREEHIDELIRKRPHGQLWAFATANPPRYRENYVPNTPGAENPYNLSMTNAHESDLYSPNWRFEEQPVSRVPPLRNKTKLVAWMASRCVDTAWRRTDFVKYLQTYLDIDIYGECSGMGRLHGAATLQQYRFYLSFENSECREYITEKVARNAFSFGAVPIVYGSRPQDYARMLPANSYIDLHEFDSIGDFVNYIQALDNDVLRYNRYFDWQKRGVIQTFDLNDFMLTTSKPEVNMCYLLRKFVHLSIHPETAWQKKTPDFGAWQRGRCSIGAPNKVLGFDIHAP